MTLPGYMDGFKQGFDQGIAKCCRLIRDAAENGLVDDPRGIVRHIAIETLGSKPVLGCSIDPKLQHALHDAGYDTWGKVAAATRSELTKIEYADTDLLLRFIDDIIDNSYYY